jgi:anti-sigma B factor antagonist
MRIKEKISGNVAIVTLKGKLMGEPETDELRDKINSLVNEGMLNVVLDMKGVNWISSLGLGTLIAVLTSIRTKNGDIRIANITDNVESLLAITKVAKVFKTFESVDRAVASFK